MRSSVFGPFFLKCPSPNSTEISGNLPRPSLETGVLRASLLWNQAAWSCEAKKKPFCACPRDNNVNNTSTSTSTSTTNIISQRALPLSMNNFFHINQTTIFMSLNLKPSRDRHKKLHFHFNPTLHRDILWPGGLLATCPAFAQSFGEVRAAFAFLKARMMWAL